MFHVPSIEIDDLCEILIQFHRVSRCEVVNLKLVLNVISAVGNIHSFNFKLSKTRAFPHMYFVYQKTLPSIEENCNINNFYDAFGSLEELFYRVLFTILLLGTILSCSEYSQK